MKVTHFGHACLLVEMAGTRIGIDPGNFTPDLSALGDLDAIVVTHQHPDHLDQDRLPDLLRSNPGARVIADPETARIIADLGFDVEAQDGTRRTVGSVELEPVGQVHALIHEDIPRIANVGVTLRAEGEPSLHHPGDCLDNDPGQVDVLAFPVNAPWQRSREMTAFLRRVAAPHAIPIHDGLINAHGRGIYLKQARELGSPATTIRPMEWGSTEEFGA